MAFDFNKLYEGSNWGLATPFDRKDNLPIDSNSLFPSKALADAYATGVEATINTAIATYKASHADSKIKKLTNNSYVGQILTVIENDAATVYVIEADRTLKAVGTAYNDTELRNLIATKLDEVTGKEAIVATPTDNSVEVSLKLAQGDKAGNVTLTQDANGLKADIDLSHNHDDIYVKQETGKGLSTNDLTNDLKTNYDAAYTHSTSAHAPANAQENVIEQIKVNGTAQTITGKAVDITVPTKVSDLTNDSGFLTAAPEYSIVKDADSGDYAAIYHLTKNGTNVGAAINIPKDLVVKSGSVVGNDIVLILNDEAKTEIKIPVGDLIEYVTSGSTTGDMVFVTVDPSTHKVTATITDGTITIGKLDSSLQAKINKTWEEVGVAQGLVNGLAGTGRTNETVKGNADAIAALINSLDNYVEKQQFESYVTGDEVTSSTQIYSGTIPFMETAINTDLQLVDGNKYSVKIENEEEPYIAEATVNDDGLHTLNFKLPSGTSVCSFTETSAGVYTLGANANFSLEGKAITLYKQETTPGLGIEKGAEINVINGVSSEFNIVTDKDNDRVLEIAKIAASKIVTGQDSSNNDITLIDALNNIYTKDEIGTLGKPAEGKENEAGYKPAVPGTGILGNIYSKDEVTALIQNVTGGQSAGEVLQKLEEYQASNDAIVKGYEKDGSHVDGLVDQVDALIKVGATKVEASSTNGNIRINDEEKTVYTLPTATANTIGGVKSADAENKVSVDADGIMEVKSLNVNKLVQTTGEWLILNGGNASLDETPNTETEENK